MASKIVSKILEGATELFARQGYYGASTRELAQQSDVSEVSIYRLFLSKEKLFYECLMTVVEQSLDPAQFQAAMEQEPGEQFGEAIARAVRRWYFSISATSSRLLMQAALSDNKEWAAIAYSRAGKIITMLAKAAERELDLPKGKATVAARTLILALFHFKIARPLLTATEKERDAVDNIIQQWLQGLGHLPQAGQS